MSKVCIYAISKNEEQFVDRFMDSVSDADLVLVGDTGSTDGTVEKFRARGAEVHDIRISPWRFDEARNSVIDLIPKEYDCLFSIDVDEVIVTHDWKKKLLKAWKRSVNRVRYEYAWSVEDQRRFTYDKIHDRTYRWVSPCHEVLEGSEPEVGAYADITVEHHPDASKSRSSYLGLLELAVKERPEDDRILHYYARELFFKRDAAAIPLLEKHINIERAWALERSASCRMLASFFPGSPKAIEYYEWGCKIAPSEKEPYVEYAKYLLGQGDYQTCFDVACKAMHATGTNGSYLNDRYAQNEGPYDLAGVAAFRLSNMQKAEEYMRKAHELNPSDKRLANNIEQDFTCKADAEAGRLVSEAAALWRTMDYDAARCAFENARRLSPHHPLIETNRHWFPNPVVVTGKEQTGSVYTDARISVLVTSYGRPELAERVIRSALNTASRPDLVEVLPVTDVTDSRKDEYAEKFGAESVCVGFSTMLKWNTLASRAKGDILVLACDDVIFESADWDETLRRVFPDDGIAVAYSDHGSGAMFCEFPVITKKMVETVGYAAYPNLTHSELDSWWSIIGEDLGRLYYLGEVWDLNHAHEENTTILPRDKRYEKEARFGDVIARDADIRRLDVEKLRAIIIA